MSRFNRPLKSVLAASAAALFLALPGMGMAQLRMVNSDAAKVEGLIAGLAEADASEGRQITRELELIWSRSGSSTMDLLLRKGRDALEGGDAEAAVGHLSALIDHAPDFAEAWHLRAMAFYTLEEFGQAQSDLQRALALNPVNFEAAYGLAVVMESTDRIDAAFAGYNAILAIYPAHEQAQAGRDRLAPLLSGSDT